VHLTADTWAVVGSTVGAAFLGAIVAYIGAARQQRKQAERDAQIRREEAAHNARIRLEAGLAELLAAAQDVLIGVRTIRAGARAPYEVQVLRPGSGGHLACDSRADYLARLDRVPDSQGCARRRNWSWTAR